MISLLAIHIVFMSASLIGTGVVGLTSLLSQSTPLIALRGLAVVTAVGVVAGLILLLSHPLDAKCLVLASYIALFIAVSVYAQRTNRRLISQAS